MSGELAIVVPVKDPAAAKSRLAPILSGEARRELATVLFHETLRVFRDAFAELPLLVVTDGAVFADEAARAGATVLRDRGSGLTAAVEQATAWSISHGFRAQLVIPSDIGALDQDEVARLIELPRHVPAVILCPSADEGGTNALLTAPPNAVPIWYGVGSFELFRREAAARGIRADVLRLPNLALDLDTPEDVRRFLDRGPPGPVLDTLRRWATAISC
jgi:2-phospho-L-lactate guanylyltransferase